MIRKRLLVLTACCVLSLLLAGCANNAGNAVSDVASKMGDAVSRAGEDVGETVSRVESFLDGDDNTSRTGSSRLDDDDNNSHTGSSRLDDDPVGGSSLLESGSSMDGSASSDLS